MSRRHDSFPYPGLPVVVDGSEAIAHVETLISEAACAYPITPSTTMAAIFQAAVANGSRNLWGTPLRFLEPESEHSSASAAEGVALAGGRVTNFTAGQGLILMKEVLYVIAGKRLPAVFHVGARALTSQALNIHAGHDDLMGVSDTGWGMAFARNVQEAADLAAIARRVAEATETPFFVAQDGFLTTHTLEDIFLPEPELLRRFIGDPRDRLRSLFEPAEALMTGVVQNQDAYMKGRIAQRDYYVRIPGAWHEATEAWADLTGRRYGAIDAYRCDDADAIVVAMGTIADTATAVVDHLRAAGRRVGVVTVTTYRPFPAQELADALQGARAIAIIERTDEPAAADNPLTREVKAALYDRVGDHRPWVGSIAAGLGSRDVTPGDLVATFDWLADPAANGAQRLRVLGIRHPLGLERAAVELNSVGTYRLRGHSVGGLGSVTTNKLLASLIGGLFGRHVQAYPRYGSEKKGLPTTYFLTIADEPIRTHAELHRVDLVPLHDVVAFGHGDPLNGLVEGGAVFLATPLSEPTAIWSAIPEGARAEILARGLRLYALDTAGIAARLAPRPEFAVRMQGIALVGAFLRIAPFAAEAGLDEGSLMAAVEQQLRRFFGKRGERVVEANLEAARSAYRHLIDVTGTVTGLIAAPQAALVTTRHPEEARR